MTDQDRVLSALRKGMDDLRGPAGGWAAGSEPIPTYALDLDRMADPAPLSGARRWGWSVMIEAAEPGIAHVSDDADGVRFSSLATGHADAASAALAHAGRVARPDDELRLLLAPAKGYVAFWLASPGGDRLVPYLIGGATPPPAAVEGLPNGW